MDARPSPETARVWDPIVRIFHWGLVLSFGVAWFTSHSSETLHQAAGYIAAGLITVRILWGAFGSPYARFSQFVRSPATVVCYLLDILNRRESRYVGHNPAGGAMVVTLMAVIAGVASTGWMMTTDAYYGVKWVEETHDLAAHGVLFLVFLHVLGVGLASVRHRENLIVAMITGRKRKAEAEDFA